MEEFFTLKISKIFLLNNSNGIKNFGGFICKLWLPSQKLIKPHKDLNVLSGSKNCMTTPGITLETQKVENGGDIWTEKEKYFLIWKEANGKDVFMFLGVFSNCGKSVNH